MVAHGDGRDLSQTVSQTSARVPTQKHMHARTVITQLLAGQAGTASGTWAGQGRECGNNVLTYIFHIHTCTYLQAKLALQVVDGLVKAGDVASVAVLTPYRGQVR
jgi:hypothetical protein